MHKSVFEIIILLYFFFNILHNIITEIDSEIKKGNEAELKTYFIVPLSGDFSHDLSNALMRKPKSVSIERNI